MHNQGVPPTDRAPRFEQIVRQHQRALVAIAYRMLGNLEDARDAGQETFMRFWQRHDWPADASTTFALLARILVNACIDRLRKRQRHWWRYQPAGKRSSEPVSADNPERAQRENELRGMLEAAITRLKPRQKAVFVLRDVEGYSVRETATILDASENSVLVNLHLARKNLRKWLAPYLSE